LETIMDTNLVAFMKEEQTAIEDGLVEDLTRGPWQHYRTADTGVLRGRCANLVRALVESANGNPAALVKHVRRICGERINEGFQLEEVQHALSCLEARAWRVAVERSSIGDLVRHLSIVTGGIGGAKDELARVYLLQRQAADQTIASLKDRLDQLSKGTEGHVEPDS
jgi:hypothetical protein